MPSQPPARARLTLAQALSILTVRSALMLAFAAGATFGFVQIAAQVVAGNADFFDRSIALALHRHASTTLDMLMIAASSIGSYLGVMVAVAVTAALTLHRRWWRATTILVIATVVAFGLNVALKYGFGRTRPTLFHGMPLPTTYSFPSGHAMTAMAVYGAIAAVLVELYPRLRWVTITLAALLILAIGVSRIYLGVHWPTDVVAGFAAGIPLLAGTIYLLHRRANVRVGVQAPLQRETA